MLFSFIEFCINLFIVCACMYMDSTARICLAKNADTLNQSKTKFYSLELIIAYSRLNDRNITRQIMKSRQIRF